MIIAQTNVVQKLATTSNAVSKISAESIVSVIIAPTRTRLFVTFKQDGVGFDPQLITFESVFTANTVGVPVVKTSMVFGVDPVVRTDVGNYYVELLLDQPGLLRLSWRSSAVGEEVTIEDLVTVSARSAVA